MIPVKSAFQYRTTSSIGGSVHRGTIVKTLGLAAALILWCKAIRCSVKMAHVYLSVWLTLRYVLAALRKHSAITASDSHYKWMIASFTRTHACDETWNKKQSNFLYKKKCYSTQRFSCTLAISVNSWLSTAWPISLRKLCHISAGSII